MGFSQKVSASFHHLKICKHVCHLKKLPTNEITEPLAFTVSKVELHGKVIVLQSCFRCTCFIPMVNNNRQNKTKTLKNERKNCQSLHDYMEALLMDMKSQIQSVWYRISGLSCLPRKGLWGVHALGVYDTLMVY